MEESLSLAIISDLHCKHSSFDKNGGVRNTYLYSDMIRDPICKHPIAALLKLIDTEEIKSDILICPGDIAERMDIQGLITGWSLLEEVHAMLQSDRLIATLGNHDVDSRNLYDPNLPFKCVKSLKSNYPMENPNEQTEFWAENFCIIEGPNYRVIVINSVHNHTDIEKAKETLVTDKMLQEIKARLDHIDETKDFNIAVCHHHPIQHANVDYKDSDVLDKGDLLLDLLEEYDFQLFIHGHKHDPRLRYYNSLPILCSGSFSSWMNLSDTGAQNVFHIVELKPKESEGSITSFVYSPKKGWRLDLNSYFPSHTGFGFRGNVEKLADDCAAWFLSKRRRLMFTDALFKAVPELNHLIPTDQIRLNQILSDKHAIGLEPPLPDKPKTISKLVT